MKLGSLPFLSKFDFGEDSFEAVGSVCPFMMAYQSQEQEKLVSPLAKS